jgi:uncharacterized repeat protein (TIGR01451 family)
MKVFTADGRGRIRLLVLALLAAALTLTGAAKIGNAATSAGVVVTNWHVLNDVSATILGQPSPGGNVGYDIAVANQGTATANHVTFSESIGAGGQVVLIPVQAGISCTGIGTTTLSCQLKQLAAGGTFHVQVLFKTPTAPTSQTLTNTVVGTLDSQTTGPPNNRQTDTFGPCQDGFETSSTCSTVNGVDFVTRTYAGFNTDGTIDHAFAQSLALPSDSLGTDSGGFFTANVKMPKGQFLNNNIYASVRLENTAGVLPPPVTVNPCTTCQPFEVTTIIPLAATVDTANNPFLQGSSSTPYSWSFTIPVPNGFKPTGVWHTDDLGQNGAPLPACQTDASGNPIPLTTAPGLCTLPPVVTKGKGQKPDTVTYSGLGVANGNAWGY